MEKPPKIVQPKKNKARDGRKFTAWEKFAYEVGYRIGYSRYLRSDFMGTTKNCGFRGRNRLIANEGLEDGYSKAEKANPKLKTPKSAI